MWLNPSFKGTFAPYFFRELLNLRLQFLTGNRGRDDHGLTVKGMALEFLPLHEVVDVTPIAPEKVVPPPLDTTCRRATSLGYEVTLASDAHLTRSNRSRFGLWFRDRHTHCESQSWPEWEGYGLQAAAFFFA